MQANSRRAYQRSAVRWAIASSAASVVGYLVGCTTLASGYANALTGAVYPTSASEWCSSGTSILRSRPQGCGRDNGLVAFAVVMFVLFVAFGVVATVKAVKAWHAPPYEPAHVAAYYERYEP
ncbi:MAG TPA: hypothetical protein VEH05_11115 [Streptosporangiaceae bacterium]|nr:hypothetical protein [Streptosporangiaceae bacterium]